MPYAVTTCALTRKFGQFTAVDNLTLNIKPGEICGFLGPNGAGKSTVIRMLCAILEPTSGTGEILGYDLKHNPEKIKQNIGYMSQKFSLYQELTVHENIDFFAGVYSIPLRQRQSRIRDMLALTGLTGQEKRPVNELSVGWRQRLALSCALVSNPALVFLDEPTSGVSPIARRQFFNIIHKLAGQGTTVIVSTHFMDEAERCDQIAFMSQGQLLALDTPDNLKTQAVHGVLFELNLPRPMEQINIVNNLPGVVDCSLHGAALHVLVQDASDMNAVKAATDGELQLIAPTLEDVFLALTRNRK